MKRHILTFFMIIFLSACGTMPKDRALSGAGIGAAAGTVLGAISGLTLIEGAALGAVGGAMTGILTDTNDVNFGEPAWKQGTGRKDIPKTNSTVARVQSELSKRGYDVGPPDGVMGPKTQSAIRKYQEENGLLVDGRATPELAAYIQQR